MDCLNNSMSLEWTILFIFAIEFRKINPSVKHEKTRKISRINQDKIGFLSDSLLFLSTMCQGFSVKFRREKSYSCQILKSLSKILFVLQNSLQVSVILGVSKY